MIFTKSTFSKKVQKDIDFGVVFGSRNDEKSRKIGVQKHMFFCYRFFSVFFSIFCDFGSILGGLGPSKNWQKIEKIAFGTHLECASDFSSILGAILEQFWQNLDGF